MCRKPTSCGSIGDRDIDAAMALAENAAQAVLPCLRPDAAGAALVAWAECAQSWDPQLAKLTTWAWLRMRGSARDEQRQYARFARRAPAPEPAECATQSGQIALHQAIDRVGPQLDSGEIAVLQEFYYGGGSMRETAARHGKTEDAVNRANQRLLGRLRAQLVEQPSKRGR